MCIYKESDMTVTKHTHTAAFAAVRTGEVKPSIYIWGPQSLLLGPLLYLHAVPK